MDTKLYIEWRGSIGKWVVKYKGDIKGEFSTQAKAEHWVQTNYPRHGYEIERVQVRENSPHRVKVGEWR